MINEKCEYIVRKDAEEKCSSISLHAATGRHKNSSYRRWLLHVLVCEPSVTLMLSLNLLLNMPPCCMQRHTASHFYVCPCLHRQNSGKFPNSQTICKVRTNWKQTDIATPAKGGETLHIAVWQAAVLVKKQIIRGCSPRKNNNANAPKWHLTKFKW